MFTTELPLEFNEGENSTTNSTDVFGNYENTTSVSAESGSDTSKYFIIDKSVMDILQKSILCGILPPMFAFGIVGNILALIILIRHKPTTSTQIVLIAIAIADLAFIASTIVNITSLIGRIYDPEHAMKMTVKIIIPFFVYIGPLPCRISNWLVALVSLERLIAVTRPLKVKQICTKKLMLALSIALPLSVAILTSPNLWLYEVKEITLPDGNVTKIIDLGFIGRHKQLYEVYFIVSETLLRFIPMVLIIVCNAIIITVTCTQAKWRRQKQNYTVGKQPSRDERQITKTLLTITCIFVVCLLPSTITRLMILFDAGSTYYKYSSNVYTLLISIGMTTETINSSINFVIYVTMNSAYRRQLYRIWGKIYEKKKTLHNIVLSSATATPAAAVFKAHHSNSF